MVVSLYPALFPAPHTSAPNLEELRMPSPGSPAELQEKTRAMRQVLHALEERQDVRALMETFQATGGTLEVEGVQAVGGYMPGDFFSKSGPAERTTRRLYLTAHGFRIGTEREYRPLGFNCSPVTVSSIDQAARAYVDSSGKIKDAPNIIQRAAGFCGAYSTTDTVPVEDLAQLVHSGLTAEMVERGIARGVTRHLTSNRS